jgi:molecular chaperone HscB
VTFFELYGLTESFLPDEAGIKRKFYAFSKQYHPDFYVNDPPEKQEEILNRSTLNNKAYEVLSDLRKRTEYILGLHGLIDDKYRLPADFLAEMMDMNEALMELEFDPDPEKSAALKKQAAEIGEQISSELEELYHAYDQETTGKDAILSRIRDRWYRQKYLLRLSRSFNKFAAR